MGTLKPWHNNLSGVLLPEPIVLIKARPEWKCSYKFIYFSFQHVTTSKTPYVAIDERGLVRSIH